MSGAEEWRGVLEVAQLSDLAARLRKYFATVAAAYSFFFYGTVVASYWLAVAAISFLIEAWENLYYWILAVLAMIPVLLLAGLLSATTAPKACSKTWRQRGRLMGPAFGLAFSLAYIIAGALSPSLLSVAWYPALALGYLLVYLLIEREAYRRGEVAARPFLASGVSALVTTPLVAYVAMQCLQAGWMLALSLMLASHSTAAFAALRGAARTLEARGGREGGEVRGPPAGG